MSDQSKRELREEKRQLKRAGGKHRRRELKRGLADNPEEAPFHTADFGRCQTAPRNGNDRDPTRRRSDQREGG